MSIDNILQFCSVFTSLATVITLIYAAAKFAYRPEKNQNQRITALEERIKIIENHLDKDNVRLNSIERGNRVTQEALLALLSHSIDGNHLDELRKAEVNLKAYLLDKGTVSDNVFRRD